VVAIGVSLAPAAAWGTPARETIDRIVASVDGVAITWSDAERACRFEMFLNGEVPQAIPDRAALERARDRLIDKALLLREADADGIPAADSVPAAAEGLSAIRKKFGSEAAFQSALRSLRMNEPEVLDTLRDRDRILRLTDHRLRPSAQVEPSEIELYYRTVFAQEYARRGEGPAPPLGEVESQIREILTQKRMNELLDAWLNNLKSEHRVRIQPD
jgi:hypothetical protein